MGASSLKISVEVAFVLSEVDSKNYRAYFLRTQNESNGVRPGRGPGPSWRCRVRCHPRDLRASLTKLEDMTTNPLASIPSFGPFRMSESDFDDAVKAALARMPADIVARMNNVAMFVDDGYVPGPEEHSHTLLLGLYEGTPLTERDSGWEHGSLPDRITIYRRPILEICSSREQVIHQITVTVVHEIAHHFGIGDERLHELGWG